MLRSSLPAFLVSATTALVVWALSPLLTGFKEPWDASGIYYSISLLLAGVVSGVIIANSLLAHYVGSIFGQLLYAIVFLPIEPLGIVGLFFVVIWSLLFLVGSYIGLLVRTRAMP